MHAPGSSVPAWLLLAAMVVSSAAIIAPLKAQEAVFIIRHAEQELTIADPALTEAGRRRAEAWADVLRDAGLDLVITSEKQRTRQTGEAVSEALGLPALAIPRARIVELVSRLQTEYADRTVLLVSHSGIIPSILSRLGHQEWVTIDSADHGSLFIVRPGRDPTPWVLRLNVD